MHKILILCILIKRAWAVTEGQCPCGVIEFIDPHKVKQWKTRKTYTTGWSHVIDGRGARSEMEQKTKRFISFCSFESKLFADGDSKNYRIFFKGEGLKCEPARESHLLYKFPSQRVCNVHDLLLMCGLVFNRHIVTYPDLLSRLINNL